MPRTFNSSALISEVCEVCFFKQHLKLWRHSCHFSSVSKEGRWGVGGDELGEGWMGWSTGSYHNCLVSFTFLAGLLRSGAVLFDVEHLSSHRESCGQPCQERHWHLCSTELCDKGEHPWAPVWFRGVWLKRSHPTDDFRSTESLLGLWCLQQKQACLCTEASWICSLAIFIGPNSFFDVTWVRDEFSFYCAKLILLKSLVMFKQSCIQMESYVAQRDFRPENAEQFTGYWIVTSTHGELESGASQTFMSILITWTSYKMQIQIQ